LFTFIDCLNLLIVTFCFYVYVCYFACSVFACNPVRLSLESVKGNLLTYFIRNDFTQLGMQQTVNALFMIHSRI